MAGVRIVRALGARGFDIVSMSGGRGCDLGKVSQVDLSGFDSRLKSCQIVVACDVVNPFAAILALLVFLVLRRVPMQGCWLNWTPGCVIGVRF